jgi:hypothetical protein
MMMQHQLRHRRASNFSSTHAHQDFGNLLVSRNAMKQFLTSLVADFSGMISIVASSSSSSSSDTGMLA